MKNIVLIGMPGCGKSRVGRMLAKKTGRKLVDTDALVVAASGKPISCIFAEDGEARFRDLEARCVREAAAGQGVVIATGGGVILRPGNMVALAASGLIFFLDRPIADILHTANLADRPLVRNDADKLWDLYRQRIELYRGYAHYRVTNSGPVGQTVHEILKRCTCRACAVLEEELSPEL